MEEDIKEVLEEGEKILWNGGPEAFTVLDKTNKKPFMIKLVLTALVCIALIVAYVTSINSGGGDFKPLLIVIIVAIGILVVSSTYIDARNVRKQKYYLTDKNIIKISDSAQKVPLDKIGNYRFRADADGHTSLLIGENTVNSKMKKWRTLAVKPVSFDDKGGKCDLAVFYAIPSVNQFQRLLDEKLGR